MSEVEWWRGKHGDDYTGRNANLDIEARYMMWGEILDHLDDTPESFLEIGAGSGANLAALSKLGHRKLRAVEPNAVARRTLVEKGFEVSDGTAAAPGIMADLVFTSGVLIHVPPNELAKACMGIYDAAGRYIVCIEYFSVDPQDKPYRGRRLWTRDFGSFWLDNFQVHVMGCGFMWKRTTGLDNVTWWAFGK